jgi:hypothetical protein
MSTIEVQFIEEEVNVDFATDGDVNVDFSSGDVGVDFVSDGNVSVEFVSDGVIAVDFDTPATLINHAFTHLPGGPDDLIGKTWGGLVTIWTEEPTLEATIAAGDVYKYTYGSTVYYRLVPDPYDSTIDAFYTTFDDPTLSGLVATRGRAL